MAGRIPESFIDDVLARTDLVELVGSHVRLKRSGKNYSACCPFHQEKTPSFTVSPDKQFYYCFGCGASGNAIGFLMDINRVSFVEAVETLARNLSMEVQREEGHGPGPSRDHLQPLYQTLEAATAFFEKQLRNPDIKDRPIGYLKKRGLSGQTAAHFRLGYAPQGWDNLITQLGTDPDNVKALMQTGLLVENDQGRRYDRFRDRIMFPIRDNRGRVIAFGGRVLGDDKPKYLNSPETPVFHKGRELYGLYEARKANNRLTRIVVVEGYMDVIALAQYGITYAVATLGTATSQDHIEKLFRHTEALVFCFDGDEAGRRAAWRALENALPTLKDGRQIKFLLLPESEDPDSLIRENGQAYFEGLLDESTPLSEYFYDHLSADININTLDGQARLASLAKPYLEQLPGGVFQQLMLKRLSELTHLDDIQLSPPQPTATRLTTQNLKSAEPPPYTEQATAEPAPTQSRAKKKRPPKPQSGDGLSLVDATIRIVLNAPRMAAAALVPAELQQLQLPRVEVLLELFDYIKQKPEASTASILGHWQNRDDSDIIFNLAAKEFLLPNSEQTPELSDALRRLQLHKVEQDLDQIIADGVKDRARFKELLQLQRDLSK